MPVWVVGARESAERDRAAIEKGTPSRVLMQRAGTAAANLILQKYSERVKDGAVIFAGPGNNGGDGWVVAGALANADVKVSVVEIGSPDPRKSPDAVAERENAMPRVSTGAVPSRAGVVVDALLGTGFEGEPRAEIAGAISRVNGFRSGGSAIVSLDVPSGLNSTNGQHSECVVADVTASFGGIKRGTLLARDCCGEIFAIDIGLDGEAASANRTRLPELVDGEWVASRVPPIRYDAHKGTRKHLAIVGAGVGMPGAVVLGARAALRSGIGLVRTMVAPENTGAVLSAVPSALNSRWPQSDDQIKSEIASWADAIVLGPGLGKSKDSRDLVERILGDADVPILLDADALNVFDGDAASLAKLLFGKKALVTPHVAEFARLFDTGTEKVLANRFDIGTELAQKLGAIVLLKGSPTVIFSPNGDRLVVARGSAALGTGGSGDLLAGIAGTLLAQMDDVMEAAACSAWIHGRAAELCGYVRGTTLEDVLYALPRAWNEPEQPPAPPIMTVLPAVAR
ncbi:MAG TPA: NAD(P)H-hydrate dehydratase [Gemmatimonadaceae bacterium]|nr:NAD(P)H-hydrate dehydratase [Gemmatimonadaceae bacterium]